MIGSLYYLTHRLIRLGGPMWMQMPREGTAPHIEAIMWQWWPTAELPAPQYAPEGA